MAYTAHPETRGLTDTGWHVLTAIGAVVGIVAAALGAWMEFAPVNGTITFLSNTWYVADLSTLWAPFLMMGGGLLAAISMGYESLRDWPGEASRWLVALELFVALVGITALVIGFVLLF